MNPKTLLGLIAGAILIFVLVVGGSAATYVVEPGLIEFHVGSSATDTTPAGTVTIAGTAPISAVRSTATRVAVTQPS